MSADSSGPGKPGSSPGSSKPETGEVTEGNVGNACNSQTHNHSAPHCAQCETNHTPIPAQTHSTDETHQDGASCHGDKGAKLGVQKEGSTSVEEKVSNSEQKCMVKSSYTEVVGSQSGRNEESESSVEAEDQSDEVQSFGGKQDKTCSITRSDTDARDHSDEALQKVEKINLDENHRDKSDSNSLPKGNEQKNKSNGAIPGVKDEKPDQRSGCNDTEKSPSVNESDIDDVAMQEAEIENHDQNSELKHTVKRLSGIENDIDEGAMQRAKDEKHDQNNDIDNRPERNEKDTDDKIRPSVENENNGDSDTEERPMKYDENDKGDITTQAVKEESSDVNKKINNTEKEFRENEKKDHPDNGTTKDQDDRTKSASVLGDQDEPFDDSDGGTKESKDKGALPETTPLTQTAQPCNRMENDACHQDEVGATHSEASHETSSSSQSQDDYTILDKQLDGVIDEILTESNLKESIEERKKSAREKLKSFFWAKVMDGTLSQRSHYPCATKSMPLQIFDSDIHITETRRGDAKGVMQGGGAEGGPSSSQDKLGYGKTRRTPNPEAGKPPLPKSPKIPAETNRKDARAARREQSPRDGPSSSQHNQANDPTDPSKCTTDPDVEIPFIDSEENRQGPQEQSTLQTKGAVSLHEKTSWTPNPKAGDSHFSKSCSSAGHALLSIQWNMKQETKGNEPFEIILYNGKRIKYVIQITCMPEDFYRLKFMFCNTNTVEDLSKSLLEIDCTLKSGTYEVHLGRKILSDKSEIIKDKIEGVINNVKATSNIQVHCAEIRIAEDKLVKKCEEFSSEFKRGNIAVYEKGKRVWIVGRNNEEMEVLEKRLIEDNVLEKAPYCSKDSKGYTIRYEENPRGPPGQTTLPDSSETMYAKLLHEKGMKNEKEIRRLPTPPTSGSGVAHMSKTYIKGPSTSSMKDSEMNQHHERDNFNPTLSTTHDNKSVVVEDKGGGSPISPGSLKASGPGILLVQWTREQEMKEFEIALYQDETWTFIIQIACRPSENYILRFIFDNENTAKNLQKILSEQGYELKTGTYEIHIKKSTKTPELIRDEIEKAIITVKGIWKIHVHCTVSTFADYELVEKCKTISTACAEGNVAVYVEDKKIWMIGRNEKELKKLEEKLMKACFVYKDQIQDLTETMYNSKDNLVIALGGKEMKLGSLMIGSSQKLRPLEIHCSKEDFYKLSLIFDSESFRNKAAQLIFIGKLPAVTIVINPSFRGVDDSVGYVENFLKDMLPTVTSSCQRLKQKVVNSYIEEVLKCFNGDVQVYYDEDDNTCLWFVCDEKNFHLIGKAMDLLAHGDYFEKVSNDPPSHDHDETLITYRLIPLELELCKKFNISETLRAYHGKAIKQISIDEDKCELKISVINGDDSVVKKDIQRFLDVKKDTKMAIKKIPKCCINFLKMPVVMKEIGTEVPYYVHVQNDECNPDVYSDTQENANKVVCIIEGLFLQEKVDLKNFDSGSDILKTKVEEWRKELSDMVGIDLTAEHFEIWGLRRYVEKILSQLENECQQNTKASSLELSGKDKFLTACQGGEIPFSKEEDVNCLESRAFQNKIVEIQDKHNCSIKLDKENAYPLENRIPNGWSWYFQSGQRVSFENSEVIAMQPNQTSCVVNFLPQTQQTKPGINIQKGNTTHSKNALQATIALPVWRDGQNKEKDFLRKCSQLLFLRLRDQNISTVVIELVMDSALQWPETQVLKSILYWRRHFMVLTVFCHPDKDKYKKLLPIFQELKDEPEREKICIRIEKKRFTDVKVQVLVNTVGWDLILKKGHVSNSILLAAGNKIQIEANEKFPSGLSGGEVLVTDAYNLCERGILKVFHGSLLQWKDVESIAAIKSFVTKCLCLATENGLTSIAFPALGTGNLGYEHRTVAAAMFETVRSFMEGSVYTSVKEVVFNVFDDKSIEAFFQEERKYLNKPCESGTFLPRTYRFSNNNLTFELYFGEVWAKDVKGLVVLYESSEIFKKDEKICIAECGKLARNFGGENKKQQLQSGKLDVVKIKVWRPVEWIFYLTWKHGHELETAGLALKSVEEEKLDSVAFAISKKDGVAGQLKKIIESVFAATKQIRKGSPLKKVIIVVDQPLRSAACKIVEDHRYEMHNIEKKRYRMSFTCNSQNSLQNAKAEVISALDSLKEATLNQNNDGDDVDETVDEETQYNQKGQKVPSKESVKNEGARKKERESELKTLELSSVENCSLILRITDKKFLGHKLEVIKQRLHKDVSSFFVPVKIIFPFLDKREALLKFDTYEEMVEFKRIFQLDYLIVKDFPVQAVTCVNATVSKTAKERFLEQGWTADDITENSGVAIKNLNDSLVLEGSLLEIQAAREFIKDACHQCNAYAKEKNVPEMSQNNSLDYDNSLVIQQTNSKIENELSRDDKDKTEFRNESSMENSTSTQSPKDAPGKLQKSLATAFIDKKCQFMGDLSANVASLPTEAGRKVELQEPAIQSIRQKERVRIPYLEFEILENLFPESSDMAKNVNILKKNVVEIVGNHDAVQPYRDAITKIERYQKITLDLKETDLKNFRIHQNNIQMVFPNVLVLLHKEQMHIVSHENNPGLKENVLSIISQQGGRNGNHRGRGKYDPGSNYKVEQREQISTPIQKTTLGKQVFQRKEVRVFVQPGDVFSLDGFDCLVNPTNEYLDLKRKGGLSAAVHDRAGEKVQSECNNIIRDRNIIGIGKCVSTTAGKLKYKRIIHAIVCPWKEFKDSKFRYESAMHHVQDIVKGCLALAADERMTSIVFPAIGSGQSAIPPLILANGYRLGCETFGRRTELRDIFFVIDNSNFLSLVERTFLDPLPWCLYWQTDDEYTYHMSEMCKIVVANRDVLNESDVDTLVVLEDPFMSAKGKLAKQVLDTADRSYKKRRETLKSKSRPNGSAAAITYSGKLKYKTIVQITMEDWNINKWKRSDIKLYKDCILEALKLSKGCIAMQLFVGKNTEEKIMFHYAKALAEAVAEHIANDSYSEILISNTHPVRHRLVKEEFNRLIRQACNSNAYFEEAVFLNCEKSQEWVETRL